MNAVFRKAEDKEFAERVTLCNMAPYYAQRGTPWNRALFESSWEEFENYEIVVAENPIGVLRLSHDHTAYYIRDIQIQEAWQRQGLGSQAVQYAAKIAQNAGFSLLRLRVFDSNPARSLYERMGFQLLRSESGIHHMQRELS